MPSAIEPSQDPSVEPDKTNELIYFYMFSRFLFFQSLNKTFLQKDGE